MNQTFLVTLFGLVLAVSSVVGCNNATQTGESGSPGLTSRGSVSVNGLTIRYPESFVREDLKIINNDVQITFRSHKLEIVNGLLKLDGETFGTVQKGDHIALQDDGSIQVNSETVKPQ